MKFGVNTDIYMAITEMKFWNSKIRCNFDSLYTHAIEEPFGLNGSIKNKHSRLSQGQCCPSGIRLYRGTNNTLIVRWRSSSALTKYTAEVTGSVRTHACSPEPGSYTCTVSEIVCGQVYSVVVAPLNPDGSKVQFCNSRLYSGNELQCRSPRMI